MVEPACHELEEGTLRTKHKVSSNYEEKALLLPEDLLAGEAAVLTSHAL